MATRIYHGAFGSYKTASASLENIVEALREGNIVFTNVRGIDAKKIVKAFKFDADEALDIEDRLFSLGECLTEPEKEFIRYFYVWLPKGAMLFLDEAQIYFPDNFKVDNYKTPPVFPRIDLVIRVQKYIVDYSDELWAQNMITNGSDVSYEVLTSRPSNLSDAINMQRHHGWDIILTTPNISLVSKYLRGIAEVAFFQRAASLWMGELVGGGRFQRTAHQGKYSETNRKYWVGEPELIKIDKRIFDCYLSTATGTFTVSTYKNLFLQPKLFIYIGLVVFMFYALTYLLPGLFGSGAFLLNLGGGGKAFDAVQDMKKDKPDPSKLESPKPPSKTDPSNYSPPPPLRISEEKSQVVDKPKFVQEKEKEKEKVKPDFKVFGVPFVDFVDRVTHTGLMGNDDNRRFFFYVDHKTLYTSAHLPWFCTAEVFRKYYVKVICDRDGVEFSHVLDETNGLLVVANNSSQSKSLGSGLINNPVTAAVSSGIGAAVNTTVGDK